MAVGFDASSESHTGTSGAAPGVDFSWSHAGGASARCVVVFVFGVGASGNQLDVVSVTYGGVAMALNGTALASDTATEPGAVLTYFLDNCGTGTKTVAVDVTPTFSLATAYAVAVTFTAAGACEIYTAGIVTQSEDGAIAEVAITDGSPGTNSMRLAAAYSGGASPPTAGANSTLLQSIDFGAFGAAVARETTAGQGSRSVGLVAASDDRAYVLFAVREVPGGTTKTFDATLAGIGAVAADLTVTAGPVYRTQIVKSCGRRARADRARNRNRLYYSSGATLVPSGGTVTFDAAVAGTGAVAAQADRTRAVAASVPGVGVIAAQADRVRSLDAAPAGQGTVVAQADRIRGLDVVAAGTGAVVAQADRLRGLAAVVAGTGTVAADTVRTRALDAGVAGQGAVTAQSVNTLAFAAVAQGVSVVAADVAVQRALAASVAGIGAAAADVTVTSGAGVQPGSVRIVRSVGRSARDVRRRRRTQAYYSSGPTLVGGIVAFSASAAGQATVAAVSSVTRSVGAVVQGGGAVAGQLAVLRGLAAAVAGQGAVVVAVTVTPGGSIVTFDAGVAGQGSITVALARQRALAALLQGQAQLQASLTGITGLAVVVQGQAVVLVAVKVGPRWLHPHLPTSGALLSPTATSNSTLAASAAATIVLPPVAPVSVTPSAAGEDTLVLVGATEDVR